jgi:hypothetical protein
MLIGCEGSCGVSRPLSHEDVLPSYSGCDDRITVWNELAPLPWAESCPNCWWDTHNAASLDCSQFEGDYRMSVSHIALGHSVHYEVDIDFELHHEIQDKATCLGEFDQNLVVIQKINSALKPSCNEIFQLMVL